MKKEFHLSSSLVFSEGISFFSAYTYFIDYY
jgi:hypothetical protein